MANLNEFCSNLHQMSLDELKTLYNELKDKVFCMILENDLMLKISYVEQEIEKKEGNK